MEPDSGLVEYIQANIIPQYDSFDKGHRRDHVNHVIEESLRLASHYNARHDMAYVIASYHDVGLSEGRETHHLASGRIIREDKTLRNWFDINEIEEMAQAAEDHRASSSHHPRSIYGCIVAEADRQIDISTILRRTVQYGLSHYPGLGEEEQIGRAVSHLHEKYGRNGYLKLYLDASQNAENLEQLRLLLEDHDQVTDIVRRILETEHKQI